MNRFFTTLTAIGLGAGAMYLLDPDRGNRRRALIRDQFTSAMAKSDDVIEKTTRDLQNRARGMVAELSGMLQGGETQDWVLEERVRAEMGRVTPYPGSIEVTANQGKITLRGPILTKDVDRLQDHLQSVRGVKTIDNQLETHLTPDNVPGLQGQPRLREPKAELLQENWSPTARLLTGLGGATLALYGRRRRGLIGSMMAVTGLGLAARGVANMELTRLVGVGGGRRAVDVQKAINIDASVEEVYRFWSNFENFPRFMAHVREVRKIDAERSHWVVAGPAGVPVEFDAMITKRIPDEELAWKSVPGETIKHAGIVQFHRNPQGWARVTVRMSYNPPAGVIGHAVAALFGVDPKQAMDDDLVRMKSLIETGKTTAGGEVYELRGQERIE